jgi:DnaJ family protein A protein 5
MTDSPSGFYGILNAFFDQLAMEETAACEWDGLEALQYPPFGSAGDGYDTSPKQFYNVWTSFSTRKNFSWKDKYRLTDAPDRRVRRLMEKENKKMRDEGIRDFNDAVRSLVAFVKKRDQRYVPNSQSEAERQKILRDSAAAQAARSRAANQEKMADFVMPEWAQSRGDGVHDDEFSHSEEESEVEHIECVVCNKVFKSEKQYEAHEKSKKHLKAVQQIRRQMKRENIHLDLDEPAPESTPSHRNGDEDVASADSGDDEEGIPAPASGGKDSPDAGDVTADSDSVDDEYAPRSDVENRLVSGAALSAEGLDEGLTTGISDLSVDKAQDGKKVGKAKAKREKKAARAAAMESAEVNVSPSRSSSSLVIITWLTTAAALLFRLQRELQLTN